MEKNRVAVKQIVWEYFLILAGTILFAVSVYVFTAPNQIAPGGVSGLATVINHLSGIPLGLLSGLINLPLIVWGYFSLGRGFIVKTIFSVVSFTVVYDYVMPLFPVYVGDTMLASLFGGAIMGLGIGLTFLADGSTGGLDISNKIVQKRFPHLKMGTLVFVSDLAIIAFAAYAYQDVTTALFAIISMFVCGKVIDAVLYGVDLGKMVVIVTNKGDEISTAIIEETDRGVTKIPTVGGYTGNENDTLICAVRQNQYHHLQKVVHSIDPNAFLIVTTATEVVGEGFKSIQKQ
jgi:uncharacterized membrane-anchored protein YitT (DUF2179 family)